MIFKHKAQDGTVVEKQAILDGVFLKWDGMGFLRFTVAGENRKLKLFVSHRETEAPDNERFPPPPPDNPRPPLDEFED